MGKPLKLLSSSHCHLSFRFSLFSGTIIQLEMHLYFCSMISVSLGICIMFVGGFNTLCICEGVGLKLEVLCGISVELSF